MESTYATLRGERSMKTLMVTYVLPEGQSLAVTDAAVTRIVAEHRGNPTGAQGFCFVDDSRGIEFTVPVKRLKACMDELSGYGYEVEIWDSADDVAGEIGDSFCGIPVIRIYRQ
jgi:hypothetical protein